MLRVLPLVFQVGILDLVWIAPLWVWSALMVRLLKLEVVVMMVLGLAQVLLMGEYRVEVGVLVLLSFDHLSKV